MLGASFTLRGGERNGGSNEEGRGAYKQRRYELRVRLSGTQALALPLTNRELE